MALLLVGLLCLAAAGLPTQGQENAPTALQGVKARSVPYVVLGLRPPAAETTNPAIDNQVPEGENRNLLQVLVRGARAAHHEPGHELLHDHHEHSETTEHDHKHEDTKNGDGKSREKRGYCSRCGGQIGYGGGGLGGYGGGYGGGLGGYGGGGCGSNCGGGGYGRPVYQQPIYSQPIHSGGGGYCNTCGQPLGGGGYGGGGGQSQSYSSAQSSSSSFGYGRK